jgi:hypothetical protein
MVIGLLCGVYGANEGSQLFAYWNGRLSGGGIQQGIMGTEDVKDSVMFKRVSIVDLGL